MSSRKVAAGLVAAAALCILALSACAKSGNTPETGPSGGVGTGAGGPAPTSTGGGGDSAPTSQPPSTSFPTTAEQYSKNAIDAWAANDVATLDLYEVPGGTLHTMLSCNGCYNNQFSLAPGFCQGAAGSSYCMYFNVYGDKLLLHLSNQLLGQARAIENGGTFEPTSFPVDDKAYATEALQAWNDGNDNRLKLLTQAQMTSTQIDALNLTRSSDWTFDNCQGAAGSTYCQFTSGGHIIAFQFSNLVANPPTSGPNAQHRIVSVTKQA
jgi:hypothetical protein